MPLPSPVFRLVVATSVILACTVLSVRAQGGATDAPADQTPKVQETVVVIGATPIQGLGVDPKILPSNVQTVTIDALTRSAGISLTDQMAQRVGSVHVNDATTNPFQPDVQFRGFVASPMLGLPQGLAVYQNGVRLNEPFGDTVNWDLMPENAIASINVMPGSNPLFGLNALGGAVAVQTKSGFTHAGSSLSVLGGSFGRTAVEGQVGGHTNRVGYFLAGNVLAEDGWRDFSPSRVRQLFGDLEWRGETTTVNATVSAAGNRLIGNAPAPVDLLDEDRAAIFTHPDETKSRATLVSLRARQTRGPQAMIDAMIFFRRASIGTLNGDDSAYDACAAVAFRGLLCADEGEGAPVQSQLGTFVRGDGRQFDATNNTARTLTNGWGGALQATMAAPVAGRANHLVVGVSFDGGRTGYDADTELARLTEDRGASGVGLFDADAEVRLQTSVGHAGVYAANFFTVAPRVTLMGSARFHYSTIRLRDQGGDELNGDHTFARVNPAVGVTVDLTSAVNAFGSLSVSSRVPAPSELSCADPDDPCRLPNAFVADPPLEEVVARTWEGGLRGGARGLAWNASAFRTANRDDIMFISSGPLTSTGHFQNVGDTVRQGVELGVSGRAGRVQWTTAYSFLDATFATPLTLSSPNHPDEENGEIKVEPGSRIPGVPRHHLKVNLSSVVGRVTFGGTVQAASSQFLRADEANLLEPIPGYAVVNVSAAYAFSPRVKITARVANLLGTEFATFGVLGDAEDVLGDGFDNPRFLSPGAPRAAWLALEYSFR